MGSGPGRSPRGDAVVAAPAVPASLDLLWLQAARRPRHGGIVFRGRRLGYPELAREGAAAAAWLASAGVGCGTRMAVVGTNTPATVLAYLAGWQLGATVVPLPHRATANELAALCQRARCRLLVCDDSRAEDGGRAARLAGVPGVVLRSLPPLRPAGLAGGPVSAPRAPRAPRPGDLACLAWTSGTTGRAKAVRLTHANLLWSAVGMSHARGDGPATVGSVLGSVAHVPVFVSHVLCRFLHGGTVVLFEKFDPRRLVEAIERHRITDLSLIAGMIHDVLALGPLPAGAVASVARVAVGGAPIPPDSKRALGEAFGGAEIHEIYGQTETTDGITLARGRAVFERPGTVGTPNPMVAVRIAGPRGAVLGADREGEIEVAGPVVMQGYDRDPAATAEAFRGGWLRTGDLGRVDADGHLYVTGRRKEIIITGGENVAPVEVEGVLRRHPAVLDAAVFGMPHPKWGEEVTAAVVPRPGRSLRAEELAGWVRERLAGFKRPRRIAVVERIPRNAARKVVVAELRRMVGAGERGAAGKEGER